MDLSSNIVTSLTTSSVTFVFFLLLPKRVLMKDQLPLMRAFLDFPDKISRFFPVPREELCLMARFLNCVMSVLFQHYHYRHSKIKYTSRQRFILMQPPYIFGISADQLMIIETVLHQVKAK